MARIVPKLNLNKTPELVDNNSLIFAKNIRFNANGLSSDLGFDRVDEKHGTGHLTPPSYILYGNEKIVGVIPYNTSFYLFVYGVDSSQQEQGEQEQNPQYHSRIVRYDESNATWQTCNCNWNWSGGKIDGICTINLNGDILLTVAEYDVPDGKLVPIKIINLTESKSTDDESIYTQAPKVPFINLEYIAKYKSVIPAGVYQFFIRYEIRKDFYTDWFPASKEMFAGTKKSMRTHHGGISYVDTKSDSDFSFELAVHKIISTGNFKSFQLGFIISHDDEVYARAYKHYPIGTSTIYFDYDVEAIEEIDVRDILESPYSLYNVGNVTAFKNKLYISSYNETDFNPDYRAFANDHISIALDEATNSTSTNFNGRLVTLVPDNGINYITDITLNSLDEQGETDVLNVSDVIDVLLKRNKDFILGNDFSYKSDSYLAVNSYIYKRRNGIDSGELTPGEEDEQPQTGTFTLKYGVSAENEYTSQNIDDILNKIVETVYGISLADGKIVDSTFTGPLGFIISYYEAETDPNISIDFYQHTIEFVFNIRLEDVKISQTFRKEYTLVPHQGYNFYLHLVKDNGEFTNGYLINSEPIVVPEPSSMTTGNEFPAIYPKFTFDANLPEGYVACFISIAHVKNQVAHVFDIETINSATKGHCLELDTNLYPWLNDIHFVSGNATEEFDYRASYDNESLETFGGAGECVFDNSLSNTITYGFAKMPYEANEEYIQLTQCTPFIIPIVNEAYDNYNSLNLLGYLCRVKKPKRSTGLNYYFTGSDIYSKTINNNSLTLSPLADDNVMWGTVQNSTEYTIYSNFNLNYLALTEELQPNIVTKGTDPNKKSYVLLIKQSSQLSEIYELPSMYKSYTRKLYSGYFTRKYLTRFDNTIRSSILEGDEAKVNIYKFNTTDYYNVPTDKGKIVNLVAVGDNILVHTQDSIYKFSGQNSLTAQGGEDVQMKESEPFDTGIQELFGSEFGYAGLASKEHQILSEFGYTFWDKDSGRIYLYTGNAQMKVLSDDITKLLRYKPITNIYLADDYYNNRIFICVHFNNSQIATLSYDFVTKSFISLHDFAFDWHFKTKTKCYFIHKYGGINYNRIYKVGTEIGSYKELKITDSLYPIHETENCIVDVIFNDRFEIIKTLNNISWICNKIVGFAASITTNPKTLLVAEESFELVNPEQRYKGDYIRIYSDSCATELIDISGRSNDALNDYKKVRYNLGKWTFNYFRNILNQPNTEQDSEIVIPPFLNDYNNDSSLIYGKYIVARFVFARTTNFKFEDVSFNITNDNNI